MASSSSVRCCRAPSVKHERSETSCPVPSAAHVNSQGMAAAARSHSLSRSYRAVLPTSLARVIPSPEVVRLGDLLRLSVRFPTYARIVSGRRQTGVRAPCGAGSRAELFPSHAAGHAGSTSGHADRRRGCCAVVAIVWSAGMYACFPFGACEALAVRLGPSHPSTVAVATETCSTSVVLRSTIATPTEIWTGARSRWPQGYRSSRAPPRPTWRKPAPCGSRAAARSIFRARGFGR